LLQALSFTFNITPESDIRVSLETQTVSAISDGFTKCVTTSDKECHRIITDDGVDIFFGIRNHVPVKKLLKKTRKNYFI